MRFKFWVRLVESLLHMEHSDDKPRADMFLPDFLLAFGLVLIIGGAAAVAVAVIKSLLAVTVTKGLLIVAMVGVAAIALGIAAVLCWKNQTIRILSETTFAYTTFLGNTYEYRFSDITDLRANSDSLTLFVGKRKIHMESMAIVSDRLVEKINTALGID